MLTTKINQHIYNQAYRSDNKSQSIDDDIDLYDQTDLTKGLAGNKANKNKVTGRFRNNMKQK